jgi:endonuclease YncB( thermonuclease family)
MAILWEQMRNTTAEPPRVSVTTRVVADPTAARVVPRPKRKVRSRTVHVVDRVINGETLLTEKGEYLKLARVEAPAVDSAAGLAAKSWLKAFCSPGVVVTFERKRTDKEGRTVSEVYLLGRCVNDLVLKNAPVRRIPEPPHHLRRTTKREGEPGLAKVVETRRHVAYPTRRQTAK